MASTNDMPRAANSLYKHGFDDSDDLTNRWSQAHAIYDVGKKCSIKCKK